MRLGRILRKDPLLKKLLKEKEVKKPKWIWYFDTGEIEAVAEVVGEHLDGAFTAFYRNGKKLAQGKMVSGKECGLWREWDQEGNLTVKDYSGGVEMPKPDRREVTVLFPDRDRESQYHTGTDRSGWNNI